jgi:hypothetical protein
MTPTPRSGSVSHLDPPCTCGHCNACAMFDAVTNGPKPLPAKQQPAGDVVTQHPPKPTPKPKPDKAPGRTLFDGVDA